MLNDAAVSQMMHYQLRFCSQLLINRILKFSRQLKILLSWSEFYCHGLTLQSDYHRDKLPPINFEVVIALFKYEFLS